MSVPKTEEGRPEPDMSSVVGLARELREKFYPPGSPPLAAIMAAGLRESWFFWACESRRVLNCVVRPAMLLFLGVLLWWIAPSLETGFVLVAIGSGVYAMVCVFRLERVVGFLLDVQRAPFAGTVRTMSPSAQRKWFNRVRHWLEINRLAGPNVNRVLWDRRSRAVFDRLHAAVVRRAAEEEHSVLSEGSLSEEEKVGYSEILTLLEEVPIWGDLPLLGKYLPLLILQRCSEGIVVLVLVLWLITPQ